MNPDSMFLLFQIAGISMGAHAVLSFVLRRMVSWSSDLEQELFAIPNEAIAGDRGIRLLRASYYLLWRKPPDAMHEEPTLTRLVFFLARLTGLLFPVCLLLFLALPFYYASR